LPSDIFPNTKAEQGSNRNQTCAPDARPAMYSYTAPTTELRFEAVPQIMGQFERSRNPTVGNRKPFEVQTSVTDEIRFSREFKLARRIYLGCVYRQTAALICSLNANTPDLDHCRWIDLRRARTDICGAEAKIY
jgi:hypothetical protein